MKCKFCAKKTTLWASKQWDHIWSGQQSQQSSLKYRNGHTQFGTQKQAPLFFRLTKNLDGRVEKSQTISNRLLAFVSSSSEKPYNCCNCSPYVFIIQFLRGHQGSLWTFLKGLNCNLCVSDWLGNPFPAAHSLNKQMLVSAHLLVGEELAVTNKLHCPFIIYKGNRRQ